ncbi:MAG: hypothetical protein HY063_13805 [Bacteroidetes bacterium]|nr:hypothetical protein [Bacteroidota bacterium]
MKTTKITFSIAAILFAMGMAMVSCKKHNPDAPTPADIDGASANDNNMAERNADDVTNMAGQASEDGAMTSYRYGDENILTSCATVSTDTALKTITITFNGGTCIDGHTRSGTLMLDYSASTNGAKYYRNPGFNVHITSSNYIVDGNAVSVNKTIINTTSPTFNPATTNLTWSVSATVSIVTSNGTISWTCARTKTLLNTSDPTVYMGQATHIIWSKARVGITGTASGTTAKGESFTANVVTQLVRDFTCSPDALHPGHHPFIDGALDFTPGTKKTRNINFAYPNSQGSGACDNQALLTIGTYTAAITLK